MDNTWYAMKSSGGQAIIVEEATSKSIAVAYDMNNAPLIASAPALLAALKEAEGVIRDAAYRSRGKVKAEIVGGWQHHADKILSVINEYGLE